MAQNYYTYSNTFIDGQTAKATEIKAEFEAVQSGLDAFYDDANTPAVLAANQARDDAQQAVIDAQGQVTLAAAQVALASAFSDDAHTSADAALASAGLNGFQGTYSAGTVYNKGESVEYFDAFYFSLQGSNLGNPPDSSNSYWTRITGASRGGISRTLSANTTIAEIDDRYQCIKTTTDDLVITMPNHTGIGLGDGEFVLSNTGPRPFYVVDSEGGQLCVMEPSTRAVFSITQGGYSVSVYPVAGVSISSAYAPALSDSAANARVRKLTSTRALILYRGTANAIRGIIADLSGGAVTFGADQLLLTSASGSYNDFDVAVLSATEFIVTHVGAGSSSMLANYCSVSGTNISVAAYQTLGHPSGLSTTVMTIPDISTPNVFYVVSQISNNGIQLSRQRYSPGTNTYTMDGQSSMYDGSTGTIKALFIIPGVPAGWDTIWVYQDIGTSTHKYRFNWNGSTLPAQSPYVSVPGTTYSFVQIDNITTLRVTLSSVTGDFSASPYIDTYNAADGTHQSTVKYGSIANNYNSSLSWILPKFADGSILYPYTSFSGSAYKLLHYDSSRTYGRHLEVYGETVSSWVSDNTNNNSDNVMLGNDIALLVRVIEVSIQVKLAKRIG